ncbi:porin [Gallibacterium genomosp. 3]|uniref:Membrane protein n=1 Tax=Gallibacterium genomosp. 3 TaxID=505345 RepID=A0A1A7Q9H3_9PAST|nr:porin [Gallibacterium genomosp. 3]OBX10771.1 membrane protein [Gallibacterium genomosp. 3]
MKKTLVAVAVAALAATSANAAVVYNQDGTKVELGGQLRLALAKDKGERVDLKYGSSRLITNVTHDLGDGFSALANVDLRFNDAGSEYDPDNSDFGGDVYAYNLYAGFAKEGVGALTFGRQDTNLDALGISDYTYDLGDVKQTHNHDTKTAKFSSAEWNGFSFGLDYFFGNAKKDYTATSTEQNGKGWGGALFYTAEVANDTTLTLNGGFSKVKHFDRTALVPDFNENAFVVGSELASGPFALAVDYSENKASGAEDATLDEFGTGTVTINPNKLRALEVGVKYNYLENAKVYGEYQYFKATPRSGDDKVTMNGFILGTDYWLTKNVVTYVEGGTFQYKDQDNNKDRDNKVRLGLRVYF